MKSVAWQSTNHYSTDFQLAETHLAGALFAGQLAIFLGAGISFQLGIPPWWKLIQDCLVAVSGDDPALKDTAAKLNENSNFDQLKLAASKIVGAVDYTSYLATIKSSLYKTAIDRENLRPTPLLFALGALLMGSRRGHVRELWTLNYDDLVEWYLSIHGFVAQTVTKTPCLLGESDVVVYHPHGFLPLNSSLISSDKIVLDKESYAKRAFGVDEPWRLAVQNALRSKVFLCIGLSWTDRLLNELVTEAAGSNAGRPTAFWCFGSTQDQDVLDECKLARVAPLQFSNYDEIPKFLLRVCQRAAANL